MLAASYYSLKDGLSATLMLSNQGPHPMDIRVLLFGIDGERLDLPAITLEANTVRSTDLGQFANVGGQAFQEGSVQILYNGMSMELGGAVKMINARKSLILDEELSEPEMDFASSKLEGVWWLPSRKSELRMALTNVTNSPITTMETVEKNSPKAVTLGPHETRALNLSKGEGDFGGTKLEHVGGISISHNGHKGALLARGFVTDANMGYSQVVQFKDPAVAKSSSLNGAGLRLGKINGKDLHPTAIVRNTGDVSTTVTGRIRYITAEGNTGSLDLPVTSLPPGITKLIDLESTANSIGALEGVTAGVEFEYTSMPGSVIIAVQSVSSDDNQVYRVSVVDAQAEMSSSGKYPWDLSGGAATVVYIKNVTDEEHEYYLQVSYTGGFWVQGIRKIAPHQTIALDLRRVKEDRIKDQDDHVMPADAIGGQVYWVLMEPKNLTLIGRVEQIEAGGGMSFTTSCGTCCLTNFNYSVMTPNDDTEFVGDSTQFTFQAKAQYSDCYGNHLASLTPAPTYGVTWSTDNPDVAQVIGYGNYAIVTAEAGGLANINADWSAPNETYGPNCYDPDQGCGGFNGGGGGMASCQSDPQPAEASATFKGVEVEISGAQSVTDGSTASFSVTVTGPATGTAYAWSFTSPSGAANSPNVNFTAATSQATNTDAHWFALPDQPCGAAANATYTIQCRVSLSNGKHKDKQTTLTVNVSWNPAGKVDPNEARVTGAPAMAPDANGIWHVTGMGTLARQIPQKQVLIPTTSQFHNKADAHEQAHVDHWGTGQLFGGVDRPADFYARIQNFTGTSQLDLVTKLTAELTTYTNEQDTFVSSHHSDDETQAYAVSDLIAPRYIYQLCGSNQL